MNTTSRRVTATLVCCGTLALAGALGATSIDQVTSVAAVLDDSASEQAKRHVDAAETMKDEKSAATTGEFNGAASSMAQAETDVTFPQDELAIAALLDEELSGLEGLFVEAADAMPEDKYGFKPTSGAFEGVHTFGEQVKHVAFYNYATFAIMSGEKPPSEADADRGPASVRTKSDILKYARESFAVGHRATAAISMQNVTARMEGLPEVAHGVTRLQMMIFVLRHASNHYGQMVEYLRMNGIIPPASRPTRQ